MDCNGSRTISSWDSLPDYTSAFSLFSFAFFFSLEKLSIHCCNTGVATRSVKQKCNHWRPQAINKGGGQTSPSGTALWVAGLWRHQKQFASIASGKEVWIILLIQHNTLHMVESWPTLFVTKFVSRRKRKKRRHPTSSCISSEPVM